MKVSEIDRAARDAPERHGCGPAFVHGAGHRLGLEVHEEPRLTRPGTGHVDHLLRPGMVFTIEPGVYVPGFAGVRLEGDVLVSSEARCELLANVPIDRWCGVCAGKRQ